MDLPESIRVGLGLSISLLHPAAVFCVNNGQKCFVILAAYDNLKVSILEQSLKV